MIAVGIVQYFRNLMNLYFEIFVPSGKTMLSLYVQDAMQHTPADLSKETQAKQNVGSPLICTVRLPAGPYAVINSAT